MAVAYAASIAGTESSGVNAASVDLSGRSVGDLAFVLISRSDELDPNSVPSGWSLVGKHVEATYPYESLLYYKILADGDIDTVTWGWADKTKTLADAHIYTGHHATTPLAASNKGTTAYGSGTSLDFGSITSDCGMLAVFGSCMATSTRLFGDITSYTERYDHGGTDPDWWHLCADTDGDWGGGTSDPSCTISGTAYYGRFGFHVAIAPASASATFLPHIMRHHFYPPLIGGR
jgi:hypothetical protein